VRPRLTFWWDHAAPKRTASRSAPERDADETDHRSFPCKPADSPALRQNGKSCCRSSRKERDGRFAALANPLGHWPANPPVDQFDHHRYARGGRGGARRRGPCTFLRQAHRAPTPPYAGPDRSRAVARRDGSIVRRTLATRQGLPWSPCGARRQSQGARSIRSTSRRGTRPHRCSIAANHEGNDAKRSCQPRVPPRRQRCHSAERAKAAPPPLNHCTRSHPAPASRKC
jgi:hypothetical protein